MILTRHEKQWLINNKKILRSLFEKRIEELKDSIFDLAKDSKDRDVEIRFVQEFKEWLTTINILEDDRDTSKKKNQKENKDSFI